MPIFSYLMKLRLGRHAKKEITSHSTEQNVKGLVTFSIEQRHTSGIIIQMHLFFSQIILNQLMDSDEAWYEYNVTRGSLSSLIPYLLL
jgi:hypothetical protein